MRVCGKCGALMWGGVCTNTACDKHYQKEDEILAEMLARLEKDGLKKTKLYERAEIIKRKRRSL